MGWSIYVNWPGADERLQGQHPGFVNDDHAWAEWVHAVNGDESAKAIIERLELAPLLVGSNGTDELEWPDDVIEAAANLRILVQARDGEIEPLIALYAPGCPNPDAPHDAFMQDLTDLEAIARYADDAGAKQMTLEYAQVEDSLI